LCPLLECEGIATTFVSLNLDEAVEFSSEPFNRTVFGLGTWKMAGIITLLPLFCRSWKSVDIASAVRLPSFKIVSILRCKPTKRAEIPSVHTHTRNRIKGQNCIRHITSRHASKQPPTPPFDYTNKDPQLTIGAQAAIIIAILLFFILSVSTAVYLVIRSRNRTAIHKPTKLPTPWTRKRHNHVLRHSFSPSGAKYVSHPSLEHDSGPVIYIQGSAESMSPPHVTEGTGREFSNAGTQCPGTSASDKTWSLRRAVMDVGENPGGVDRGDSGMVGRGWTEGGFDHGSERKGSGYSGAWP